MKNWFCRRLLSLALLSTATLSQAQSPVKIGNALPKEFWETSLQVVNSQQKKTTLSSEKGKLILIDFWATWCSSCLANFPKMEALQKKFGDQISIVAVTDQDRALLEKFFSSNNGKRYFGMPSIVGDTFLSQLFPHKGVPYVVWIKDGKLLNTTDAEQVTEETINETLKNEQSTLQTVVQIDKTHPLLLSENFDLEKGSALQAYAFLAKGRIRSTSFGTWFHRTGEKVYGRQYTNLSLIEIYTSIVSEIFFQNKKTFFPNRVLNKLVHPEEISFDTSIISKDLEGKLYSIDFIVPISDADLLYNQMLAFINSSTPYKAEIKTLNTECYVLTRTSSKDKIKSKGGIPVEELNNKSLQLKNYTLDFFISFLNGQNNFTQIPVIDETGYDTEVDLQFSNVDNLLDLQKQLQKYDLSLEKTYRQLSICIITDKL